MSGKVYWHRVSTDKANLYDGPDSADAMAAWSRCISEGAVYVMLESLRSPDEKLREKDIVDRELGRATETDDSITSATAGDRTQGNRSDAQAVPPRTTSGLFLA